MLETKAKRSGKGLTKIGEEDSDEEDKEEEKDVVPAVIIGASRKNRDKEACLD